MSSSLTLQACDLQPDFSLTPPARLFRANLIFWTMINYGFNNSNGTARLSTCDAEPQPSTKDKGRRNPRLPRIGMSGCGDLPGNGLQRADNLQMQENNGVDNGEGVREYQHQLLEIGDGPQVRQTAFWLDVVPGV